MTALEAISVISRPKFLCILGLPPHHWFVCRDVAYVEVSMRRCTILSVESLRRYTTSQPPSYVAYNPNFLKNYGVPNKNLSFPNGLPVCLENNLKSYGQIFLKFSGNVAMAHGTDHPLSVVICINIWIQAGFEGPFHTVR